MISNYSIYQLKGTTEQWDIIFEPLHRLRETGFPVDRKNYDLLYAGLAGDKKNYSDTRFLLEIFYNFHINFPPDFDGRFVTVSDVVILRREDKISAYFVDPSGFCKVPEFLNGPYRYYSLRRPVDIGTFPKTDGSPLHIENYDSRIPVENGQMEAWGALDYAAPLDPKQVEKYELWPAPDNPDVYRIPPRQLKLRTGKVGLWESEKNIPENWRITVWNQQEGFYQIKDPSKSNLINQYYKKIMSLPQPRIPIAAQLAEAKMLADKNNTAPPTHKQRPSKDRE